MTKSFSQTGSLLLHCRRIDPCFSLVEKGQNLLLDHRLPPSFEELLFSSGNTSPAFISLLCDIVFGVTVSSG